MTENVVPLKKDMKAFRHLSDDPLIEVVCVSTVTKHLEPRSFRASTIKYQEGVGADKSAIILQSGEAIILSLSYADLVEKLDEGSSPIDLREYCNTVVPLPEPTVGDKLEDGSILAGVSPKTSKPMFAMPADAGVSMDFNQAAAYAQKLNAEKALGHDDWRVPTKEELAVLFENREKGALKGTFNVTGSYPAGWYWSSTPFSNFGAWCQRFSDGPQLYNFRNCVSSVRCVR